MKNGILGVLGAFFVIYTTMIGLGVYNHRMRYEEMANALGQVLKQTLENEYGQPDSLEKVDQLKEDILYRMGSNSHVEVEVHCMNLEKGIISVTVKETYTQINGQQKTCEWTKTAIMERQQIPLLTEEGGESK